MALSDDYPLRPMSDFVEFGWLAMLNLRVAHPAGVQIGLYVDDVTGVTALGWAVLPHVLPVDPPHELQRIAAFYDHIAQVKKGSTWTV